MRTARAAIAMHPRQFGRRAQRFTLEAPEAASGISDELRLFATTFAGGFLFVSVLLA